MDGVNCHGSVEWSSPSNPLFWRRSPHRGAGSEGVGEEVTVVVIVEAGKVIVDAG